MSGVDVSPHAAGSTAPAFHPAQAPCYPRRTTASPSDADEIARRGAWRQVLAWVVGAFAARLLLSWVVPLLPDETYYWEWTRRLDWGYFDHPPGVALLIKAGALVLGDTAAGVRAGPLLAALATHLAAVSLAWSLAGRALPGAVAASRAASLVALLPIAAVGLVPATPDAALFAAATFALVSLDRALAERVGSNASTGWWLASGIALGAALVAKYTAVLLPLGLLIACLAHPRLRPWLREPGPYLALLIAASIFAPVLQWNAQHDWVSFRFQLGHGFGPLARGTPLSRELELLAGQFGLASPVLFVLLACAVFVALRDGWRARHAEDWQLGSRRFALAVLTVVTLAFFATSALRRTVEPNWPALIYPGALALLATESAAWARTRAWRAGIVLATALLSIALLQAWRPILPLAAKADPFGRAHGWEQLATAVEAARADPVLRDAPTRWAAADRYQEASELAFLLPEQPTVFSLNLGGRANQYDLWPTIFDTLRVGDALVAVLDANAHGDQLAKRVGAWFADSKAGVTVQLTRGRGVIAERRIWTFRGALGTPTRPPRDAALSGRR